MLEKLENWQKSVIATKVFRNLIKLENVCISFLLFFSLLRLIDVQLLYNKKFFIPFYEMKIFYIQNKKKKSNNLFMLNGWKMYIIDSLHDGNCRK